jgi:hypothetical protein
MEYAKTGSLTAGGSLSGSAQSATSGTAVAYSTLSGTPAIEIDPAYHIHPPRPHHQHQGTTAAPVTYFNLEPSEPALPLEWVLFYPSRSSSPPT